ncbi:hypothetical protein AVEN_174766-1 [Araneus ventricosus]|uniref:DNA helicase Pif1-like 2B domain-containing protein n=1 Tax=Araneus ventricosus TaxID=182803 RepID=A0A4Y2BKD0_ARAVE|nr:hypothetical protein AVEN_174766-1 [Araneus ventricosus]
MRDGVENAQLFSNRLLEIGEGRLSVQSSDKIKFPPEFCNLVSSIEDLIDEVYFNISQNFADLSWSCERTILAPINEDLLEINTRILTMIPGAVTEYRSFDTVVDADKAVNFPPEFLNSLDPSGLPPHRLTLKTGCPI